MKSRSGQGLSVNMIILIALGIVILVIAILMFRNSTQKGQEAAGNCELLGGSCEQNNSNQCPGTQNKYFGNCGQGMICCSRADNTAGTDKTRP